MMMRWRLWLGLAMMLLGFALRDHAHAMAAHSWVIETASRIGSDDANGPPACVFDCTHKLTGDAATPGLLGLALMIAGMGLLVWSSVMHGKRD
jgi:hypothetical protein